MNRVVRLPISGHQVAVGATDGHCDLTLAEGDDGLATAVALCDLAVRAADGSRLRAAELPMGDVEYLVVELRRAALGSRLVGEGSCERCGSRIDLSFDAGEYLAHCAPRRAAADRLPGGGGWRLRRYQLTLRAPTAADVLDCSGYPDAKRRLAERCFTGELAPAALRAAERALRSVAPLLRTDVVGRCPECAADVTLDFDACRFCLTELSALARSVLSDVVTLAGSFHWSEAAILALPRSRREQYVESLSVRAERAADAWVA